MGYYISIDIDIDIPDEKQAACLAAINELHTPAKLKKSAGGGKYQGGKMVDRWYRWVRNPGEEGFSTLEEAFRAWRYETDPVVDFLNVCQFIGEKLGDDEVLYAAIAPFVKDGGGITVTGEEGEKWGYRFREGQLIELRLDCVWVKT